MKKHISFLVALCLVMSLLAAGATASGGDAARDDLVLVLNADIATMHPSDYSTTDEHRIGLQIYDTLLFSTLDGAEELSPLLAESWEISDDGLEYIFHLRQDVTFHNGAPMTAADVVFSLELFRNSRYQGAVGEGLDTAEIIDDYTVKMTTAEVTGPFLESLGQLQVASKAYFDSVSEEEFAQNPIGTGAYKFVSHSLGSSVTLASNEDYFRGAPAIKNLTFRVLSDDATIAISLQTGELDFVNIKEANYANLEGVAGLTIQEVPESRFGFISMNYEKEPYNHTKFRQAVAYAIDRQNLIDTALDGIGTANSNLISPLRFGYSDDLPEYTYDPEKSKELLAEAGIETPYDLGVMQVYDMFKIQAQVIQNDLAAVGLNVAIEIVERNTMLQNMFNGDIGITTMSMTLEGGTEQYALALTSPYVGMANNVRYSNPEIDALFEEASHTLDEDACFKLYNQIFRQVQEEAVFVVLYNTVCLYAYNENLYVPALPLEGNFKVFDFYWMQ